MNGSAGGTANQDWLVASLAGFVEPLARIVPAGSEIVLHDLRRLPNSIVAMSGDVTGRRVGDPATNVLLEQVVQGVMHDLLSYETRLPDGRRLRSSTSIIRDADDVPVAALCVNTEVGVTTEVVAAPADAPHAEPARNEVFAHDVEELAGVLLGEAIAAEGVPVAQMKKRNKLNVVGRLHAGGMFLLRDAIEIVAAALDVSKFTIYNYLNELGVAPQSLKDVGGLVEEPGGA